MFTLLLALFSCACSANSPSNSDTDIEPGAPTTLDSTESCESGPVICEQMQIATQKMHELENEILKTSAKAYTGYLAEDPEYVRDIQRHLDESDKAWNSYIDAQCQLEPYINGMSRKEVGNIAEYCRLERTKRRISELEGLLTTLKSNQESRAHEEPVDLTTLDALRPRMTRVSKLQ